MKLISIPICCSLRSHLVSCDHDKNASQSPRHPPARIAAPDTALPKLSLPPDSGPPPAFDSTRAMQYVKEIVAFGPRPVGSANHKKVEDYLLNHLKSDEVENDIFTADTPEGKFPVHNIVAKFPGTKDGVIVIASHYDTNYPLRNTTYIGANDGASSSALFLNLPISCAARSARVTASGWYGTTRRKR